MSTMSEQKALMVRGEPYRSDDEELAHDRLRCQIMIEQYNATSATDPVLRHKMLHDILGHLGDGTTIAPPFHCDYGYQIRVGDRTRIDPGAIFIDSAAVTIGSDVQIGPSVQLLAATRPLDPAARRMGFESAAPITIGFGAWLGGGVIICPGVTVGDETVVAAGAVVTADLAPRVLVAGNPARIIRNL
jgi:maltose O-acetyltransferase